MHRDAYSQSGGGREASDRALDIMERMERGGDERYGYGENTGMIIPYPNARTYMVAMTAVSRSSSSLLGPSSSEGGGSGNNDNNSDNNDDA